MTKPEFQTGHRAVPLTVQAPLPGLADQELSGFRFGGTLA